MNPFSVKKKWASYKEKGDKLRKNKLNQFRERAKIVKAIEDMTDAETNQLVEAYGDLDVEDYADLLMDAKYGTIQAQRATPQQVRKAALINLRSGFKGRKDVSFQDLLKNQAKVSKQSMRGAIEAIREREKNDPVQAMRDIMAGRSTNADYYGDVDGYLQ